MKTMPIPKDEKCRIILITLLIKGELRFKDLKQELKNKHIKMPEPTLLMHLNHLLTQKLIIKTIKSPKNVTYRANINKFEEFKKRLDESAKLEKEITETFLNLPIEEQIYRLKHFALIRGLACLKYLILFEKYGRFEDSLMFEFIRNLFNYPNILVVKKCSENEEYMNEFLKRLEEELKQILN